MREDWVSYRFDEVFDLQMGKTPARDNPSYWGDGNIWVSIADMKDVKYISSSKEQITDVAVRESGIKPVKKGTAIMSFKLSIGKAAIASTDLYTNEAIMSFSVKDGHKVKPEFIYYFLKGFKWAGANKAVMGFTLNKKTIASNFFSYPPIAEQEKIVAELDCLTGIIKKKKQQLEELDKLAQSIFYEMFGDIAHNSKQFHVEKICDLGELARGVSKHRPRNAPELLGGEMPLIQTGDVANADLFIREYHSTYSALGVSQSRVWEKGTICITIAANIGNCAILSFRACFPDSVVGFIHNDKLSLFYALFVFNNLQALLEEKARGIAQKNINLQILNELLIPVPPRYLQDLFAEKIEAIEKQKELVKQSIVETETLFNSRMDFWFN